MARLTRLEKEAVIDLLNERLAGGTQDIADALGMDIEEAAKIEERVENAIMKLTPPLLPKKTLGKRAKQV